MLTLCVIAFAVVGYRAAQLRRSHAVWIAAVALVGVLFATEQARKVAAMHGNLYVLSWPSALEAWLYSAVFITAGLAVGHWIGRWQRLRSGRSD